MGRLIQQVLPLLVFLLFTSPASLKFIENFGEENELGKKTSFVKEPLDETRFVKEPLDEASFFKEQLDEVRFVKEPLDEASFFKEPLDEARFVKEPLDEARFVKEPLDKARFVKEPLDEDSEDVKKTQEKIDRGVKGLSLTECNDDEQLFLWSPYEIGLEFLRRVFYYLRKSKDFNGHALSELMSDDEGVMAEILTEKIEGGAYSKKRLEASMNLDMSGFMVDVSKGDVSPQKMNAIHDSLKQASIDITGKQHSSVIEIMKFLEDYERIAGCPADDDGSYGGLAAEPLYKTSEDVKKTQEKVDRGVIKEPVSLTQCNDDGHLFLWSPPERGLVFLKCASDYLSKFEFFNDRVLSELMSDDKGGMAEILTEKTKAGVFSKKRLEASMNLDMSGFMVDVSKGDVSHEKMNAIYDSLNFASIDITGKEHSSVKEIMNFLESYERNAGCRVDDDRGYGGSAAGTDICLKEFANMMMMEEINS